MGGGLFAWILVLGGIGFFVWLGIMWSKKKAEYMSEGKMIQRAKDFMEYGEIFTLRAVPVEEIRRELQSPTFVQLMGTKGISENGEAFIFKSGTVVETFFVAQLVCQEHNEERMVYRFDFVQWKTSYGSPTNPEGMNLLLTAIEKMFLSFDPNTQVSTAKNPTRRG